MPAFLYYLPGENEPPPLARCRALGLGYALEREPVAARVQNVFGAHGFIVADPDRIDQGRIAFHAGQQQWQKWQGIYVGMYTDQPPSPGDLQRRKMLAEGTDLELADERVWRVPIARQWMEEDDKLIYYPALPRQASIDDAGEWGLGDVLPKHQALWDLSVRFYDALTQGATFKILPGAAQALGANYVVSDAECSLLGCLSVAHARAVLEALIQWPLAVDLLQKKMAQPGSAATAGSASSSGPGDETKTTALPCAT